MSIVAKAHLLAFTVCILASCGTRSPKITFNYNYDKTNEILDTTNTGLNPWYLTAQRNYFNTYNSHHELKCLINPDDLSGIYWKPDHFINKKFGAWEVPGRERYYIMASSEGLGFEGYSILNFIHVKNNSIEVDVSYGSFSNNMGSYYSSSFFQRNNQNAAYRDSIIKADSALIPNEGAGGKAQYDVQLFDNIESVRKLNTLFFGIVPHEIVTVSMEKEWANIVVEMTPEEYLFRLLDAKNKFSDEVRQVTPEYLYGDFQEDWRYLLRLAIRDGGTEENDPFYKLLVQTQRQPNQPVDNYLFPNLDIQSNVINETGSLKDSIGDLSFPATLVSERQEGTYSKKRFELSRKNSLLTTLISQDSALLVFDTTDVDMDKVVNREQVIAGNSLLPLYYIGGFSDGEAQGTGTLYLVEKSIDTAKYGCFVVTGNFKKGLLEGQFQYTRHTNGFIKRIVQGNLEDGRLVDSVLRYSVNDGELSASSYENGNIVLKKKIVYHNYDIHTFFGLSPKLSDSYMSYIDDRLYGMEIPADTSLFYRHFPMLFRDSVLYFPLTNGLVIVPYTRNYQSGQIIPNDNIVILNYGGGTIATHWDNNYLYGGESFFVHPAGTILPIGVKDGQFFVPPPAPPPNESIWDKIGGAITHFFVDPIKFGWKGVELLQGKVSPRDFISQAKADLMNNFGKDIAMSGDILYFLGEKGQVIVSLTYPVFKALQDYNVGIFPLSSEVRMLQLANKKFKINNPAIEKINILTSYIPELHDKIDKAAAQLVFKSIEVTGTIQQKLGTYLQLAAGGFPKAIANTRFDGINRNANSSVQLSNSLFEGIVNKLLAKPVDINNGAITTIDLSGTKLINFDESLKAINVSFADGNIYVKSGDLKGQFTIKNCTIELLPAINRIGDHYFLDLYGIVTFLELKNSITETDKMIAWAIQSELLNNRQLASIDISSLLPQELEVEMKGAKDLKADTFRIQKFTKKIIIENAGWGIVNGQISLALGMKIKNQSASAPYTDVQSGKGILENLFGLNCSQFPEVIVPSVPPHIENPDVTANFDSKFMTSVVSNLFDHPIEFPFTDDPSNGMSNHYFVVTGLKNLNIRDNNMINLGLSGDVWVRTKLFKTKLTLADLEVVINPKIQRKDTLFYLSFPAQIKFLDIKGLPETFDKCVADFVTNKGYLKYDSLDISKFLSLKIKNPFDTTVNIGPKFVESTIITDRNKARVQLKQN